MPTTGPTTAATTTVPLPPPGRWNIALLGGDAGPYRWGMRTDTMIVVSIDRQTGDLASVSVPRNLRRLPTPPGVLRDRFPNGFDDLANALYTYVMVRPELGLDPAQVVKGALAELLGIPIDHYVLVDMQGFIDVINALGGVTVDLSTRVELIPNMDRKTEVAPYVGPGQVTMDGAMALSFVRTREQDSDYGRMGRQRCLLAAAARSTSPTDLALNYVALASAIQNSFRSDIPRERLGELVSLFAKVNVDRRPHVGAGAAGHPAGPARHRQDQGAGGHDARRRGAGPGPVGLGAHLLNGGHHRPVPGRDDAACHVVGAGGIDRGESVEERQALMSLPSAAMTNHTPPLPWPFTSPGCSSPAKW